MPADGKTSGLYIDNVDYLCVCKRGCCFNYEINIFKVSIHISE